MANLISFTSWLSNFELWVKNRSETVWINLSVSLLDFLGRHIIQMNQYCFYKSHRNCIFIPDEVVKILKEFKRIKIFYIVRLNWVAIRKPFYWGFWQPTELEFQFGITKNDGVETLRNQLLYQPRNHGMIKTTYNSTITFQMGERTPYGQCILCGYKKRNCYSCWYTSSTFLLWRANTKVRSYFYIV